MKTVIAILIDPAKKRIEAIQLTSHSTDSSAHLKEIKELVGVEEIGHTTLPNGDSAWGDDNGLLKDWTKQAFFRTPFYPGALAGRYVITRYEFNAQGGDDLADCHTNVAQLWTCTEWIDPKQVVIPAPTVSKQRADGTMSEPVPIGGGPANWTIDDNPGIPKGE